MHTTNQAVNVVRRFTRSCSQGLPNTGDVIRTRRGLRLTVIEVNGQRVRLVGSGTTVFEMPSETWAAWCRQQRAVRELRS